MHKVSRVQGNYLSRSRKSVSSHTYIHKVPTVTLCRLPCLAYITLISPEKLNTHPRLREKPLSRRRRLQAHRAQGPSHVLGTPQGPQSKTRRSSFAMWAILMATGTWLYVTASQQGTSLLFVGPSLMLSDPARRSQDFVLAASRPNSPQLQSIARL